MTWHTQAPRSKVKRFTKRQLTRARQRAEREAKAEAKLVKAGAKDGDREDRLIRQMFGGTSGEDQFV